MSERMSHRIHTTSIRMNSDNVEGTGNQPSKWGHDFSIYNVFVLAIISPSQNLFSLIVLSSFKIFTIMKSFTQTNSRHESISSCIN